MYCRRCNIHFSGEADGGGRCPSCGGYGGSTPQDAGQPAGAVLLAPPPPRPAGPPSRPPGPEERTRTERLPPNPWSPGTRIAGKYEVIGPLGSGGFGTVHKVRHIFRKKYYALKTPHPQFLKDEIFRRRFEREIEAMERFAHPDAVMVRDCGVTEFGIPYYTMDFIDGESLKAVLLREHRLAPERAVMIVRRVLRVLEAAHENQIIHRDMKPDNILLTHGRGREQVKVLDFGVAKLLDLVGWTSLTQEAQVGTPRYMSPEQITGDPIDARSDLFSLGIIFYEMVTGEHPFARDHDPVRVTASILNRVPVPPRDLVTSLPRALSDRMLWMLEKKRRKRPAAAGAVLAALAEFDEEGRRVEVRPSALEVFPGAARRCVSGLVLRQEKPEGERRFFLLFKERVTFGRSSDPRRGENDLILRCLPCRSEEQDPENWRRNLTISHRLGAIYLDGSAVVIEPDPAAPGGIAVSGVKSLRPAKILSDRFHFSLGDHAMELDGLRRLRRPDRRPVDLGPLARPAGRESSAGVGFSLNLPIDHVHLRRADNFPSHEYFLVFRQVALGSAVEAGLRLSGAGIEGEHALLIYEGGEAFLAVWDGEVRIRPAAAGGGRAGMEKEIVLSPGVLYPLVPGVEIGLGFARLSVDAITPDLYKKV